MTPETPVVVTGAAGFVGFHVSALLLSQGRAVIGVDRGRPEADDRAARRRTERLTQLLRHPSFTPWSLDLSETAARDRLAALTGSPVVHLAAQPGVRTTDRGQSCRDNLLATTHVLEAAVAAGSPHVVFASSSSVYGDAPPGLLTEDVVGQPLSFYAATKLAAEQLAAAVAHEAGLPVTAARLFNVYGPWGRPDMVPEVFARAILDGQPVTINGDPRRDLTFAGDVAGILADLLDQPPSGLRRVNVGAGASHRIRDVLRGLEARLGRAAIVVDGPARPEERGETRADTARLRALLGRAPDTTLDDGLDAFCAWYLTHHRDGRG